MESYITLYQVESVTEVLGLLKWKLAQITFVQMVQIRVKVKVALGCMMTAGQPQSVGSKFLFPQALDDGAKTHEKQ